MLGDGIVLVLGLLILDDGFILFDAGSVLVGRRVQLDDSDIVLLDDLGRTGSADIDLLHGWAGRID